MRSLDVLLDGERIAKVGANLAADPAAGRAEIFDANGLIVAPGFIDLHCHLREPGQEMSETIETGTRAAARGGFTAVCAMPNTQPVNDNASVTRGIVERAAAAGERARVADWRGVYRQQGRSARRNRGDEGRRDRRRERRRQADRHRAADAPGDGLLPRARFAGDRSLRRCVAFRRRRDARRPAFDSLGLKGIPAQSESICVGRDVEVAALTGARLHIAHMSTRGSLEYVRAAKKRGCA